MTIVEIIRAFGRDLPVGIVITDASIERPGPTIVYANSAFGHLVGRDLNEIIGQTPRFMQGKETRRATLDAFHHALRVGERFHGFLTNYRADGTKYRAEIDCRPLSNVPGKVEGFIAFEREVVRRIGRPFETHGGRYEAVSTSNDLLGDALRGLGVFSSSEADLRPSGPKEIL
ncbi:PAS domain-containing protein [Methylobacterium sp. J-072]|uniref:PAS domain-containing protein n=1 Tax=Methylobacterium sp. J-072 TaxID=2836651 RepID=UPI001FBB42A3|nr:PAS domain-containing protein [Methylobacterium sp. J-072]MCJ2091748.1 PAS domain-containing protein [Methylobacterium sp. J-072]